MRIAGNPRRCLLRLFALLLLQVAYGAELQNRVLNIGTEPVVSKDKSNKPVEDILEQLYYDWQDNFNVDDEQESLLNLLNSLTGQVAVEESENSLKKVTGQGNSFDPTQLNKASFNAGSNLGMSGSDDSTSYKRENRKDKVLPRIMPLLFKKDPVLAGEPMGAEKSLSLVSRQAPYLFKRGRMQFLFKRPSFPILFKRQEKKP
ncbi:unnamed protein product [Clavelina lepadiformis]|uniref:Uncharacterized protein n=1 Tax=Clavelina lepadiformis TaxID=159417 RepID=A0ABP0FE46_CLALP